jgi:hypothetical protein
MDFDIRGAWLPLIFRVCWGLEDRGSRLFQNVMSLIFHRMIFVKTGIIHHHHCENCKAHIDSCCQHDVSVACTNVSGKITVIG